MGFLRQQDIFEERYGRATKRPKYNKGNTEKEGGYSVGSICDKQSNTPSAIGHVMGGTVNVTINLFWPIS